MAHILPVQLTRFVGRVADLDATKALLASTRMRRCSAVSLRATDCTTRSALGRYMST